jgi:hypothetical protein
MHDDPNDLGRHPNAGALMTSVMATELHCTRPDVDLPIRSQSERSIPRESFLAIRALRLLAFISSQRAP